MMVKCETKGKNNSKRTFMLSNRVNSSNPQAIRPVLENLTEGRGSVRNAKDESGGFIVNAEMDRRIAKDLNRMLLSALRKVEKKTTLRAEWTSPDGSTERYFDYVLKKKEQKKH